MKAKVVTSFRDKYTGKIHQIGEVLPDISEKRFNEILSVGPFVEKVEEPKEAEEPKTPEKEEKPKKNRKK